MTDPRRFIDDPAAPAELRRALRAERSRAAPDSLRTAVWGGLASHVGAAAAGAGGQAASATAAGSNAGAMTAGGGAAAGTAGAAVASTGLLKAFLIGAGIGSAIAVGGPALESLADSAGPAGSAAHTPTQPALPRTLPAQPGPAAPAPQAPHAPTSQQQTATTPARSSNRAVGDRPGHSTSRRVTSPRAATSAAIQPQLHNPPAHLPAAAESATRSFASSARQEAARVAQARERLRRGDGAACLAELGALAADIPSGVLHQERQALRVEALVALGRQAEAQRAASSFLEHYPESPLAGRVRSWARIPRE